MRVKTAFRVPIHFLMRRGLQTTSLIGPILGCLILLAFAERGEAAPTPEAQALAPHVAPAKPLRDAQPPTVPQGMRFSGKTRQTVSLVWRPARDNVRVAGYRLFRNGVSVATVKKPGYVYRKLRCGRRYTFALQAYDAAGNASNRAEATGSIFTNACLKSRSGPPVPAPRPRPAPLPGPPGTTPTVANLWVDGDGGSCARRASPSGYSDAQACTWNRAYQAAQTGDMILVKGANYGDVTIGPNKPSISAPGVTFRTAAGESVVVRDFENGHNAGANGGSNIRLTGPVTARTFRSDGTSNLLVESWRVDCGGCDGVQIFHLEDAVNATVRNSDISDNQNNSLIWINGTDIAFEHNTIHDAGLPASSSAHTECIYAWNVTGLTLRGNHFYHCSVMDVFITGGAVANGGLVENNVFERPWENTGRISTSAPAFHFRNGGSPSPDPNNWEFRYNTFVGGLSISPGENPVGPGGMRVTGNVFLSSTPCGQANTVFSHNAFTSRGCGTNNIVHSFATYLAGFTATGDPGTYSLRANSVLRNKGNPAVSPGRDRAGRARSGVPDIGAYEFVGT